MMSCTLWRATLTALRCTLTLVLPKGHKDLVPFLMHDHLLGQDGLGAGLFPQQVVFAHEHSVGELGAGGREQLLE